MKNSFRYNSGIGQTDQNVITLLKRDKNGLFDSIMLNHYYQKT